MLHFLREVWNILKLMFQVDIDSLVSKLHYILTCSLLMMITALINGNPFSKNPIDCIVDPVIPASIMDNFCYNAGTISLPRLYDGEIGNEVLYTGVGQQLRGDKIKVHNWYYWTTYAFMFSFVCFYVPRFIWESMEGGRVKTLIEGVINSSFGRERKKEEIDNLVDVFSRKHNRRNNYAAKFYVCEALNLVNVIGQTYFMNWFTNGDLWKHGHDLFWMTGNQTEVAKVFPLVTQCTYYKSGPSGNIINYDSVCHLYNNKFNQVVFVFTWYWFQVVAILTTINGIYCLVIIIFPSIRNYIFIKEYDFGDNRSVRKMLRSCKLGDWFLLNQIGKNIPPETMETMIQKLAEKLVKDLPMSDTQPAIRKSKTNIKFARVHENCVAPSSFQTEVEAQKLKKKKKGSKWSAQV